MITSTSTLCFLCRLKLPSRVTSFQPEEFPLVFLLRQVWEQHTSVSVYLRMFSYLHFWKVVFLESGFMVGCFLFVFLSLLLKHHSTAFLASTLFLMGSQFKLIWFPYMWLVFSLGTFKILILSLNIFAVMCLGVDLIAFFLLGVCEDSYLWEFVKILICVG
jgi:hypothetical protein